MKAQTALKNLLSFARALKLSVVFGDGDSNFYVRTKRYGYNKHRKVSRMPTISIGFNPRQMVLNSANRSCQIICVQLAHEIGHYLVAPAGRRHRKDYGIPTRQTKNTYDKWDLEEAKAQCVDRALLKHFGVPGYSRLFRSRNEVALEWFERVGKKLVRDTIRKTSQERRKMAALVRDRRSRFVKRAKTRGKLRVKHARKS